MRTTVLLLLLGCHQSSAPLSPTTVSLVGLRAQDDALILEEYVLGNETVETIARLSSMTRPDFSLSTDGETALILDLDISDGFLVTLGSGAVAELRYSATPCDPPLNAYWIDAESFIIGCGFETTPWVGSVGGEVVPLSDLAGDCELVDASPHHQRLLLRCPDGDFLADGRARRLNEIVGLEMTDGFYIGRIVSQTEVQQVHRLSGGLQLYRHGAGEPVASLFVPYDEEDFPGLGAGPARLSLALGTAKRSWRCTVRAVMCCNWTAGASPFHLATLQSWPIG